MKNFLSKNLFSLFANYQLGLYLHTVKKNPFSHFIDENKK